MFYYPTRVAQTTRETSTSQDPDLMIFVLQKTGLSVSVLEGSSFVKLCTAYLCTSLA